MQTKHAKAWCKCFPGQRNLMKERLKVFSSGSWEQTRTQINLACSVRQTLQESTGRRREGRSDCWCYHCRVWGTELCFWPVSRCQGVHTAQVQDETAGIERERLCQAIKKKKKKKAEWKAQGQDKRLHAGDSAVAFLHRGEWRLMVRMEMAVCMNASTAASKMMKLADSEPSHCAALFSIFCRGGSHRSAFSLGTFLTFNTWKKYIAWWGQLGETREEQGGANEPQWWTAVQESEEGATPLQRNRQRIRGVQIKTNRMIMKRTKTWQHCGDDRTFVPFGI